MSPTNALKPMLDAVGAIQTGVICTVIALILAGVIGNLSRLRYPADLPRIREPKGRTTFSLRTRLAYYTDAEALFRDAYLNV